MGWLLPLLLCGLVAALIVWSRAMASRRRVLDRLAPAPLPAADRGVDERPPVMSGLSLWLARAGFRHPGAPTVFVVATLALAMAGLVTLLWLRESWLLEGAREAAASVPGGIGESVLPLVDAAPWLVALLLAVAPLSVVRSRRRELERSVEQDLPFLLELLATLAEAGMGFDAALSVVLEATPVDRPLAHDLRQFQADVLAGVGRTRALRGVSHRLDVPGVSILVSALVQADQVGAGVSETLRHQAAELRRRRREAVLAHAQTLPVRLVFPLVICFLPGIFVFTLGPAFVKFFEVTDSLAPDID